MLIKNVLLFLQIISNCKNVIHLQLKIITNVTSKFQRKLKEGLHIGWKLPELYCINKLMFVFFCVYYISLFFKCDNCLNFTIVN